METKTRQRETRLYRETDGETKNRETDTKAKKSRAWRQRSDRQTETGKCRNRDRLTNRKQGKRQVETQTGVETGRWSVQTERLTVSGQQGFTL